MYDVIIIGAGVSGSAIAREISKDKRKVAVLEKESDLCEGTSKANSGIVHGGFDAAPGTLKALLNVKGSKLMPQLAKTLDFPYKKNGSLVVCFNEADRPALEKLMEQGEKNGVEALKIIDKKALKELEPNISDEAVAALYVPTGGIVCPFNLNIALAEHAAMNGVSFFFETKVETIHKIDEGYELVTNKGNYKTKVVINAAGVYADVFHNMVSSKKIHIIPRKGEYCLMDKKAGRYVERTIFQLPTKYGKGVLVTPTVHGNLLVGPTAVAVEDKEEVSTTREGLCEAIEKAALSVVEVPRRQIITSFAGLRAHEEGGDFIIEEIEDAKGFIDVAGIESPGLTCAPAIGEYVADIVQRILPAERKTDFIETRKGITHLESLSKDEIIKLIEENPAYGNVICRCELVTEGEILEAIHRPLGATTLDGVKRRTRTGMGRCQAGFCSPKTVAILARELEQSIEEITKKGGSSYILIGENKEAYL